MDDLRYIGVDLGNFSSCICYTRYQMGYQQYDDPSPVIFHGEEREMPSILWLDENGKGIVASGSDVFRREGFGLSPEHISSQFKSRVRSDPTATDHIHLMGKELYLRLMKALGTKELPAAENITTVGLPVEWRDSAEAETLLTKAFDSAGFPNIRLCLEPAAVVLYAAFFHKVYLDDRPLRWLVIDLGEQVTRFSAMETLPGKSVPNLCAYREEKFGGRDFDTAFLEKFFVPKYVPNLHLTPQQMAPLIYDLRKFKEGLSLRLKQNEEYHREYMRVGDEEYQVDLDRRSFLNGFGRPLVDQFRGILAQIQSGDEVFKQIDYVVLCGGSANWEFIQEICAAAYGEKLLSLPDYKLALAQGLALASTGFKIAPPPPPVIAVEVPASIPPPPPPSQPNIAVIRQRLKQKARKEVLTFAGIGTVFTLVVSFLLMFFFPVPGVTTFFLFLLEIYMLWRLTQVYQLSLSGGEKLIGIAGLAIMSFVLKFFVGDLLGMIPFVGPLIKTFVAGIIIYALGEMAISICDQRRFDPRFAPRR